MVDPLAFWVWYLPLASKINFEFLIRHPKQHSRNSTYRLISPSWSSSDHLTWSWHELVWLDWHCWHKVWTTSHLLTSTHNSLNILNSWVTQIVIFSIENGSFQSMAKHTCIRMPVETRCIYWACKWAFLSSFLWAKATYNGFPPKHNQMRLYFSSDHITYQEFCHSFL